jgi:hypothetical protein
MPQGLPIDIADIHQKLWDAKDRNDVVKIYQKQFALYCGISAPHMSRVIKRLKEEGRIKKIGSRYRNVGVYSVYDPADFDQPEARLRATGVGPATMKT